MILHKQFYFVRHGLTEWNHMRKLQGSSDIPLNEVGISQAHQAAEKLSGQPIGTICCSPLQRARKTADIVNKVLKRPIVQIDSLRECDFGPHEGTVSPSWLREWRTGDDTAIPTDIEPMEEFLIRTTIAINRALEYAGPVLIVAHGGTYIPANKSLPPDQRSYLQNCQPVRHDPPSGKSTEWKKVYL